MCVSFFIYIYIYIVYMYVGNARCASSGIPLEGVDAGFLWVLWIPWIP